MSTKDNKNRNEYMREYRKRKTFKQLKVDIKPDDFDIIDNFCKNNNISKARFIVNCCKYCIDNDIDIFDKR